MIGPGLKKDSMQVPLYRHNLFNCDIDAVMLDMRKVLTGMSISSGPVSDVVQDMICEKLKTNHCNLTSSWTTGCIAVLMAFGFKPGSEIIIPACTFIATANAIRIAGLTPVVVDIDPKTKLIDMDKLLSAITAKTVAVMPVHLYGQMVDLVGLRKMLPSKIKIIEDAAHALEASRDGISPGQITDAAIFSFYASKNLTTGEGGAVTINDPGLHIRFLKSYRHGVELTGWQRHQTNSYVHAIPESLAIKANMPDILAVLLKHQLLIIDETQRQRRDISMRYQNELFGLVEVPYEIPGGTHARHMFAIGVSQDKRNRLLDTLVENGIKPAVHYMSLTQTPALKDLNLPSCPIAETWGEQCISIPLFAGMTEEEQSHVINVLKFNL